MSLTVFSAPSLDRLTDMARERPRLRQHHNIHADYSDVCQRLFNAIEPGSYIPPHRHAAVPRNELLMAIRGRMVLITFDHAGGIEAIVHFGSEKHGADLAAGIEVPSHLWHTVIALTEGALLLEVKAGPFDPAQPKELAPWAPAEGSAAALDYLAQLRQAVAAAALA